VDVVCRNCLEVKDETDFYKKQKVCKVCHKLIYYGRDYRNSNLKKKYGITSEEFEQILTEQGGVCKVCGGPPHGKGNRYHVDHNHKTGRIRGILCHKCNVALGMVQDSEEHLMKLIKYIQEDK